jgi:hypothetical protein
VRLDPTGRLGPTRGQARSARWRQSSRGFYVPAAVDASVPEQRAVEASVLLPTPGAVTGWAALRLHGAGFFDGLGPDGESVLPVPLVIGPAQGRRPRAGITWCEDRLDGQETLTVHGVPVTRVERALFDAMRRAGDVREAVVSLDMAAAAELTSVRRMQRYVTGRPGWDGVPLVREALGLGSEYSRSPAESRMRLVWLLDARLPPPRVNQPVWDAHGRLLGVADLLDPVAGLVGEYDGADHRRAGRHARDVAREDRMRRVGLEYFTVTGPDLRDHALVADRMVVTRRRARFEDPAVRRWTLRPPGWWEPVPDLDAVLDEQDARRELYTSWEAEA